MAKKKNTLKYILIAAGAILIIAIAGNKLGWFGKGDITQVSTDKVEKRSITETVSASGKIQPEIEVKLSSEVSGEVVELAVKEGDVVKRGQLLCKIRPDVLQSGFNRAVASLNSQKASLANSEQQLKQAQANYENTAAKYKRSVELYKQKVLSASEYDAAVAEYNASKANIEAMKQNVIGARYGIDQSAAAVKEAGDNLAKTTIYAPVDGVVSKLEVELGERVVGTAQMAGTEIMRIANLNSMEANVDVNESDINRVSPNDPAEIEVDAFQGKKFKGVVTEIGSSANVSGTSADQVTNFTIKVKILPESYQALLVKDAKNPSPFRPGLSATVDIHTSNVNSLSVPIQAVTTRDEEKPKTDPGKPENNNSADKDKEEEKAPSKFYVFILQNGKAKQVQVTTGIQDDAYIQILSGLKGGEEVISRPFSAISKTLKDGMIVEKVSKDKLFSADKK
ncbi:efflux RND transporter periplasmic adaptor subunit [Pedobacter sp. HMF7647]|uniref:Efflux RND transporter periplasmic adaptor subunit n=1 Tax=Hufsiella arboris TaxID=2695275 RepID=A0A7K1Y8F1_9SPHI|nr:efflux RND transporter periplasmic adaptor subunit [Hufsiella arboris]MXV50873.1 efflux RND transporter periplasmic adaptor subunit [Hufsiella arboris]